MIKSLVQSLLCLSALAGSLVSAMHKQAIPMIVLFIVWVVLLFKEQQSGLSKGL